MLKYILLTQKNLNLLQECYNILKQCGETMFKEHGLEHWLPPYPLESIQNDCLDKLVFLVFDEIENKYVSTFQGYLSDNHSLYIRKVATIPDYQGKGVGKKNLAFIENLCKKLRINAIELDVYDKSEQAVGFYLANGFVVTGKRPTRRFEVLLMRKDIL